MSDEVLNIRTYNVGLGDTILISIPSIRGHKHILVDFGSTRGKDREYLEKVWNNIKTTIKDEPLAVVLTHGHLDHFKGLHYFLDELEDRTSVFVTTKYLRTSDSIGRGTRRNPIMRLIDSHLETLGDRLHAKDIDEDAEALTAERVDTGEMLDEITDKLGKRIRFVERGSIAVLDTFLLGTGTDVEILGPEEDDERYSIRAFGELLKRRPKRVGRGLLVDRLKTLLRGDETPKLLDMLLAERSYDNMTSVVFSLEWKGRRLLFPGDAELECWDAMYEAGVLKPVDFLKVSHHASDNGTPINDSKIWKQLVSATKRNTIFVVSTYPREDWGMPSQDLLEKLKKQGLVYSTEGVEGKPGFIDIDIAPQ